MPAAVVFALPSLPAGGSAHDASRILRAVVGRLVNDDLLEQELLTFSVAMVVTVGGEPAIRIATIEEKTGTALQGLGEAKIPIDGHEVLLRPVEAHPLAGRRSYEEIFRKASATAREFCFEFLTPTSFHHGDLDVPLPLSRQLYNSLYRRWKHVHTRFALHEEVVDAADHHLAISSLKIETTSFKEDRSTRIGFTGTVAFKAAGSVQRDILHELNVLADYAFFASAGQKTQIGMGVVRRVDAGRQAGYFVR